MSNKKYKSVSDILRVERKVNQDKPSKLKSPKRVYMLIGWLALVAIYSFFTTRGFALFWSVGILSVVLVGVSKFIFALGSVATDGPNKTQKVCPECDGEGSYWKEIFESIAGGMYVRCRNCDGKGYILE